MRLMFHLLLQVLFIFFFFASAFLYFVLTRGEQWVFFLTQSIGCAQAHVQSTEMLYVEAFKLTFIFRLLHWHTLWLFELAVRKFSTYSHYSPIEHILCMIQEQIQFESRRNEQKKKRNNFRNFSAKKKRQAHRHITDIASRVQNFFFYLRR